MATSRKPRLAVLWTSGCGGCEAAFLDLGERLLVLEREFELAFFPMLLDRKLEDLESLGDGAIDVSLVTGAIRSTQDVEMSRLLRRTSKTVVAFGACAQLGSVLALADLVPVATLLETVFKGPAPGELLQAFPDRWLVDGPPRLPELTARVQAVEAVADVDYSVPGCPPEIDPLWSFLQLVTAALRGEAELPPPGSVLGSTEVTVCEECPRQRPEGPVTRFVRPHLLEPDPSSCLLDQGLVCSGPATRGGCGAPCLAAGAACRGCYGYPDKVADQGARMLAALAALAEIGGPEKDEEQLRLDAERILATVVDPVGNLYRYSFARSLLADLRQPGAGRP
jgi:F420-non-reducing hydrogenase small subunit